MLFAVPVPTVLAQQGVPLEDPITSIRCVPITGNDNKDRDIGFTLSLVKPPGNKAEHLVEVWPSLGAGTIYDDGHPGGDGFTFTLKKPIAVSDLKNLLFQVQSDHHKGGWVAAWRVYSMPSNKVIAETGYLQFGTAKKPIATSTIAVALCVPGLALPAVWDQVARTQIYGVGESSYLIPFNKLP